MTGVTKRFGRSLALDSVDFQAEAGQIQALVGENGAGKTTLMRVLYGALKPDSGSVAIDGQDARFTSSAEAIWAGIGMVSQHYSIVPRLTCLQNLMLGAEPGFAIDLAAARARATDLAAKMGYSFEWDTVAETLSPAGAQKLEILKLLWRNARIMVLDEPTAMLSPSDSDALFESLLRLAAEGATVIVVTHRLPEVLEHCKTVTVLRGGRLIEARPVAGTTAAELAELIVGHTLATQERAEFTPGAPLLEVSGLTVRGYRGDDALRGATFSLGEGELVGIAGVDGNGQRELFGALTGVLPAIGKISCAGNDWSTASPARRIADGLRLIPEDRHAEGVVEEWSLAENAVLGLQRLQSVRRGPWLDWAEVQRLAEATADRFGTKRSSLAQSIGSLSGGNQQRFVAARALGEGARVVLAFQPTRGLDVDGTSQVYGAIRQSCRAGACALVVSFDLDELLEQCDRVLVLNHGVLSEPAQGLERDRQAIGRMMVGAA
jgi:general nucleoside transport system ATP-binding protein